MAFSAWHAFCLACRLLIVKELFYKLRRLHHTLLRRSEHQNLGVFRPAARAVHFHAGCALGAEQIDADLILFRLDQLLEPRSQLAKLIGREVALEDRVLHSLAEVPQSMGQLEPPPVARDIVGDYDQHGK